MKNIFKTIGLLSLICFSFFYTDKTVTVVKNQDPIMIKIMTEQEKYFVEPISAIKSGNTITPGLNGKKIDVEKSYNSMKKMGTYNSNLLQFTSIYPDISIFDNYNFYISLSPLSKNKVSLIFKVKSDDNIDDIIKLANTKNIAFNFFVDSTWLNNNTSKLKLIANNNVYNYGFNGKYTKDVLLINNNIINKLSNNKSLYCYSEIENKDILKLCSDNKMHTIIPSVITKNNPYSSIKNNLQSGSIISFDINDNNIKQLNVIVDYIIQKGYDIITLSDLLDEDNDNDD
ncbi:MAG: hypothetical protein Q4G04_01745 [bacterium]|nr:hypothetical protein [bacterium]